MLVSTKTLPWYSFPLTLCVHAFVCLKARPRLSASWITFEHILDMFGHASDMLKYASTFIIMFFLGRLEIECKCVVKTWGGSKLLEYFLITFFIGFLITFLVTLLVLNLDT